MADPELSTGWRALPQCRCLVIHHTPTGDARDRCSKAVTTPDSPFCEDCQERHVNHGLTNATVTAE